ncbi:MAG: 30S ribosome-binding factor RbfA [Candidatus Marinamargulisbacteria bacterium]
MSRMIRIESLLKQEISRIIQQDFRSNLGLISITGLKIAKDLSNATVFYSHMGSEAEKRKSFEKLRKSASFIKGELGKHIRLKRIPNLTFRLDDSLERGFNIVTKLNQVND